MHEWKLRKKDDRYEVRDLKLQDFILSTTSLKQGKATTGHSHVYEEAYCFIKGCGTLVLGESSQEVKAGDIIIVPGRTFHRVFNNGCPELLFLCVFKRKTVAVAGGFDPIHIGHIRHMKAAKKLGADTVINPTRDNTVEAMLEATGGSGPDIIFECAGAPVTLDQALTAVRREGKVIYVALGWEPTPTLPVEWVGREVEMKCSYAHYPYEWEMVLELMAGEKIKVDSIVVRPDDYFNLNNIQQAFELCVEPGDHVQITIVP